MRNIFWLICCVFAMIALQGVKAAEVVSFHGYSQAIELKNDSTRVVLCPEVGGRVLEYSLHGDNALYLSEAEQNWRSGDPPQASAGRFDIGPELVIPPRPTLWSGEWQGKITGPLSARLTSPRDASTGVQLIRDFRLAADSSHLSCRQTILNISDAKKEWCHWSRTFAVGHGIVVIPLSDQQTQPISRFPEQYVLYEAGRLINMHPQDPAIRRVGNTLQIHPTPRKPKLGFDSYAGAIAYYCPNDLLFVKKFKTFPDGVYNEAAGLTISVWYPDRPMVELEPIGPRQILQPGQQSSFTEHWWLHPMKFPGAQTQIDPQPLQQILNDLQ